jgi:hypothetical protein
VFQRDIRAVAHLHGISAKQLLIVNANSQLKEKKNKEGKSELCGAEDVMLAIDVYLFIKID